MKPALRPYVIAWSLLISALILSVMVGSVFVSLDVLASVFFGKLLGMVPAPEMYATILLKVRLPHTLLILLTGAALAGSGAAYQGLFRNPLADPYLIGVASGAGLGAVLAFSMGWPQNLFGLYAIPAAAFGGAVGAVFLAYQMGKVGKVLPASSLILAGVAISAFSSALTSFLMLRSNGELHRALAWLMGGGTMSGWDPVWAMLPYVAIGLGVLMFLGHTLNVLQFGDEQAHSLGLPVEHAKLWIVVAASLATAAAVAFAGVIGFIGLVVPHVVRLLVGTDYRRLLPLSMLGGASALLVADALARTVLAPQVLPVGIITALTGAPFFLWLLQKARAQAAG